LLLGSYLRPAVTPGPARTGTRRRAL